ncbi:sulfotransferase family cytosolic 2B member 1-like [Platysternon megacephalum]|uniref:Sulfotransferase family cytosolic 2B member 1-like n=1 Tax=Platysternon megacephalum TaxID=55544 RepID=A0A4D9DJ44_9SAUR|nr:sulfotransferase family cytosolic 2B member 1-like [Platysternon megacephalum]
MWQKRDKKFKPQNLRPQSLCRDCPFPSHTVTFHLLFPKPLTCVVTKHEQIFGYGSILMRFLIDCTETPKIKKGIIPPPPHKHLTSQKQKTENPFSKQQNKRPWMMHFFAQSFMT